MPQNAIPKLADHVDVVSQEGITVCPVLVLHIKLTKPKVAKCYMSRVVEQDVFGLEVPVNHIEAMQAFQSTQQLGSVKS